MFIGIICLSVGTLLGIVTAALFAKVEAAASFTVRIDDTLGRQVIGFASGEVLGMIARHGVDRTLTHSLIVDTSPIILTLTDTTGDDNYV